MATLCELLSLACLLCACWLVSIEAGEKPGDKPDAGPPQKDPCSPWEVELKNQLINASTVTAGNRPDLYKISEKCINSFSLMSNLTRVQELIRQVCPVYDNLNPGSRMAFFKWIEGIYSLKASSDSKGKDGKSSWITSDVLTLLDRFILQAPMSTLSNLATMTNSSICYFYKSNTTVWSRLFDLTAAQAKSLTDGLTKCGINVTDSKVIPRLGQIPCFFADLVEKMNPDSQEAMRNVLVNCTRNVKDVYQKLLKSINPQNLTSDMLKNLGKAATGLNLAQISTLSASAVNQSLESFGKCHGWSLQQRRALIKKLNVTDQDLSKMGALAPGLSVGMLQKFKGKDLLKALSSSDDMANSTKAMSAAQRKTIVGMVLKDGDLSTVLSQLPRNLAKDIPLSALNGVSASLAEEMLKKNPDLSKAQAITLMKKMKLDTLNSAKAIGDLNGGVRGLVCSNINLLNMDALGGLGNSALITPFQLQCAARQYFKLMNKGNFSSLTQEELDKIPPSYLLYLPSLTDLKTGAGSLCPSVLARLGQADIKLQKRSSPRRGELLNFVKSCLNITDTKTLTANQASDLGSLVCTFGAAEISNLPSSIFQGITSQFMACGRFEGPVKEALKQKILSTFNATSTWTKDTLVQLGVLVAVLNKDDLATIPNTDDVKLALSGIMSSVARPKVDFVLPEFENTPDMKAVAEKLANILLNPAAAAGPGRRKRAADCATTSPDADMINLLGELNLGWKPEQLSCLSNESFMNALDTLSRVEGFSPDQLNALKTKALQVYGSPLPLDLIAALRRITLAFSESEVAASFGGVDTDTLAEISGYPEWASSSYKTRSATILKNYLSNGRTVTSLIDTDLVALGYFLCSLTPDQIKQINGTSFSGAMMNIGKLTCPDNAVVVELKNKAIEVYGMPSIWTREVCQEVGTVAAGLSSAEIAQLPTTVMSFLTPGAVSLLPPKVFSSLTPAQLMNLGPENSATVSDQQKSSLSKDQRDALTASDSGNVNSGSARWISMSSIALVAISLLVTAF